MPARYTPPRPYRACQGTVWQWLAAVQAAVDDRTVPGLTGTTLIVARGLLAYADRNDGTTRPGLDHLGKTTRLARRTVLLHLGLLVQAGLLVRIARGRHATLVELLATGRARHAAVYRLALPQPPQPQPAGAEPPGGTPAAGSPGPSPVRSCTPPGFLTSEEEPPVAREAEYAGLTAGGDPATTGQTPRRAATLSRRPPPAPGTRRWAHWQAADQLRGAVPLVLGGCSTPAVASAMRQGLAEGWTVEDFVLLLQHRPLPARPDRLGGRADLHRPAGLLAWRVTDWFHTHGPLRPTTEHADQLHARRIADIRRRADDAHTLAELRDAAQHAVPAGQARSHAARIRRKLGWIRVQPVLLEREELAMTGGTTGDVPRRRVR